MATLHQTGRHSVAGPTSLDVRSLTVRTGAEITGVDVRSCDTAVVEELRRAVLAHRVVFLPGQHLEPAEHVAFAGRLGPLTRSHPTVPFAADDPAVFDLDSLSGAAVNYWHTDVTYVERPPSLSVISARIVPEVGGDTLWANTVAGYADLPADLRQLADQLRAVHSNGHDYGRADVNARRGVVKPEQLEYVRAFISQVFETEHPVARVHPETQEQALLLGGFAQRLVGHSAAESVDLMRIFQSYVTRPENVVRWHWTPGDLVIWDNRSTQHYAIHDYGSARRHMQRVTVAGVPVVGVDGSVSVALQGDAGVYYDAAGV